MNLPKHAADLVLADLLARLKADDAEALAWLRAKVAAELAPPTISFQPGVRGEVYGIPAPRPLGERIGCPGIVSPGHECREMGKAGSITTVPCGS